MGTVHFISGADGFTGSYFLYSRAREPETFITLGVSREELHHRLEICATSYRSQFKAEEWEARIKIVSGNTEGQNVDNFWYFADANTSHTAKQALELARAIGAKRFIHVGTACNEDEITDFCTTNRIDYSVLRLSIVIGPTPTMKTGGCRSGLYGLIRDLVELKPSLSSSDISLAINPATPVNLLPIDHLLADISYLIENDFPGGPIYDLANTQNLSVDDVLRTIFGIVGIRQTVRYDSERSLQQQIDEKINFRLQLGVRYETSLSRKDGVRNEELYGYVTECMRELRCETEVNLFERKWLQATNDHVSFCSYITGDTNRPAVVLINAIGMPVLLLTPLARQLAQQFRVLTWESRWAPSPHGVFDPRRCDLDHHLTDLKTLLEFYGVGQAHFVGWCNGAQLALKFASLFPDRMNSLVLLNGTFNLPDTIPRTAFEKNMRVLMPKIAGNISFAQLYYRMTSEARFRPDGSGKVVDGDFNTCRNPALRHLTNAPFKTPELLYRYANMVTRSFNQPEPAIEANLAMPVLVISGSEDRVSHPDTSREIARRIKNASLAIVDGGDHHALHDDERVLKMVADFLSVRKEKDYVAIGR